MPQTEDQANDPAFEVLNQYLERLQQGDYPDRQRLLEDHPELAPALKCLEALESLAPTAPPEEMADADLTATLDQSDGSSSLSSGSGGSGTNDVLLQMGDFGDYELLEEIGRGGMGVVYKARQKSLDRIVAVKVIASLLASGEQIRRFKSEAKAAAGINHPHVVHIHEVGEIYGQHYFAMEYVSGTTLAKRLDNERLSIEEAVGLMIAVAHAVDHLHQHDVVHRDLKPSNILLDDEGKPKVTDFGLAKVSTPGSRESAAGVIAGTPSYMSPEQAAGRGTRIGPASDVYSLGTILYELLTGRPPFRGDNPLEVLLQVREREAALPRQLNPKIPVELELICQKCLEKSPEDRYASAAALADDLERYLKRESIEATPPHVGQRLWRWARREPALATRAGALAVFYTAVTIVFFVSNVVKTEYYRDVTWILFLWLVASFVFQRMLTLRRWPMTARVLWALFDTASLTAVLHTGDGVASPMVVGYPLLIIASGLWLHVPMVWLVVASSMAAYTLLVTLYYRALSLGHGTNRVFDSQPDRHAYFLISLIVCGCLVAYQVSRTRALNQYFERRKLP